MFERWITNTKSGLPISALRIGFGAIWAIDAVLKWMSGFRSSYLAMVQAAGQGQPSWLHWWFSFWTNVTKWSPSAWAYVIAVIETSIAIALIVGFRPKVTYIGTAIYSLGIWAVAEGFGGPYTSGATDVGTGIIYALVAITLLAVSVQMVPRSTARTATTDSQASLPATPSPGQPMTVGRSLGASGV